MKVKDLIKELKKMPQDGEVGYLLQDCTEPEPINTVDDMRDNEEHADNSVYTVLITS